MFLMGGSVESVSGWPAGLTIDVVCIYLIWAFGMMVQQIRRLQITWELSRFELFLSVCNRDAAVSLQVVSNSGFVFVFVCI